MNGEKMFLFFKLLETGYISSADYSAAQLPKLVEIKENLATTGKCLGAICLLQHLSELLNNCL